MTSSSNAFPNWFGRRRVETGGSTDETEDRTTSTTGGGSEDKPVVVWEAANRLEAQIVQGRLESQGIPAILSGEALGPIYGLTTGGLAATNVLVPAALADRARDILASDVDWDEIEVDTEEGDDAPQNYFPTDQMD